jgi:hypothetical protein
MRSLGLPGSVKQHVRIKERQRGFDEATFVESFIILNAVARREARSRSAGIHLSYRRIGAKTVNPLTGAIGGTKATIVYSGLTLGFAGLYQINVMIPPGLSGSQPVVLTAGSGNASRAGVNLTVVPQRLPLAALRWDSAIRRWLMYTHWQPEAHNGNSGFSRGSAAGEGPAGELTNHHPVHRG